MTLPSYDPLLDEQANPFELMANYARREVELYEKRLQETRDWYDRVHPQNKGTRLMDVLTANSREQAEKLERWTENTVNTEEVQWKENKAGRMVPPIIRESDE